jgi:hypothetical protein
MIYDELRELHETDPDLFEVRCREIIEDVISSFPAERQERARQLQWRIDQALSGYTDPIARMNKMVELFWEGVSKFQDALEGNIPQTTAKVLSLPQSRHFP